MSTWVPAGYYMLEVSNIGDVRIPARDGVPTTVDVSLTSRVTFTADPPKGVAKGRTKGKARTFVNFPRTRSCASRTASVKWTKKARKQRGAIKRIAFHVGKKKVGQVKKVKAKQVKPKKSVKLKKLPRKAIKVRVTIMLRNGKKLVAKQKYSAC